MAEAVFTCCQKLKATLTLCSFLPSTGWRHTFPRVGLRALGRGMCYESFNSVGLCRDFDSTGEVGGETRSPGSSFRNEDTGL